jgi:hypothetical protein
MEGQNKTKAGGWVACSDNDAHRNRNGTKKDKYGLAEQRSSEFPYGESFIRKEMRG